METMLKEHPSFYNVVSNLFGKFYEKRIVARGTENIPEQGPAIIVSNHFHKIDPVMFNLAIKKHFFYMAKEDIIHDRFPLSLLNPLVGYVLHFINSYPSNRIKMKPKQFSFFYEAIKENKYLMVFPTGKRSTNGSVRDWYTKATSKGRVKRTKKDIVKFVNSLYTTSLRIKDKETESKIKSFNVIIAGLTYDIITKKIFINIGKPYGVDNSYLSRLNAIERKEAFKEEGEKIISGIESLINVNLDSLCSSFLYESVKGIANQKPDNGSGRYKLDEGSFIEGIGLIANKVLKLNNTYKDSNLKDSCYRSDYIEKFFGWLKKEKVMEFDEKGGKINLERVLESPFKKKNIMHLANRISHFKKADKIIKKEVKKREGMISPVS